MDSVDAALAPDPALEERVVAEDVKWDTPIYTASRLEVELASGERAGRDIAWNSGGAGALAVRDGLVCLVRQYRVSVGRVTLEIPSGRFDEGETGAECAARELREETGLLAGRMEPLVTTLGAPGFTSEHTEVYLAQGLSQGEADPDPGEYVNVVWLPAEDVLAAVLDRRIQDAKTVAAVLAARARGLL